MTPDLSIAVVSYNTCELLRVCLSSLIARQAAGEATLEIIVADNGSSDGSREMVRTEFPTVTWLELGENVGFGRANNAALQDATGRYFCLLNSDAAALPGALAQTLAYLEAHAEVGLAGGQLLWPDGRLQTSWGCDPTLAGVWEEQTFLREVRARFFPPAVPSEDHPPAPNSGGVREDRGTVPPNPTPPELGAEGPKDVEQICGAYMVVRREAWQQIGGFDPAYFMYNEDVDLNVRLRRAGWRVVFLPSVHITHHLGASSRADWQTRARMVSAYNQSRFYYFTRFQGAHAGRCLRRYCLLGATLRLVGWSLLSLVKPNARDKVKLFREVWRQTWALGLETERRG